MDHAFFVTASYAVSVIGLLLLTAGIIMSARRARARVEALEAGASNRIGSAPGRNA